MVAAFAFILVGVLCFFAGQASAEPDGAAHPGHVLRDRGRAQVLRSPGRSPMIAPGGETGNAVLAQSWLVEAWGRAVQTAMNAEAGAVAAASRVAPALERSHPDASPQPSGSCGGATNGADRYIARESGGDPNVWNQSGSSAWGCWQILASTWHGAGCDEFGPHGSASVEAQAACASRLPLSAWGG